MLEFETGRGKRDDLLEKSHKQEIDRALEEMMEKDTARQLGELARTGTVLSQELSDEMKPTNEAEEQAYKDYEEMLETRAAVTDWNRYERPLPR